MVAGVASRSRMPEFTSPLSFQVWAALMTLEVSLQFELLRELATRFAMAVLGPTTRDDRVRKAVVDLHIAADIYGHSPSVKEYRRLCEEQPELKLTPEGTIRRWLGGGWNDCLRLSGLDTVSDGDFAARPSGTTYRFPAEDVYQAVRDCTVDLGHAPSWSEYFAWVDRPDVQERPGRRPRSNHPFERLGGFRTVLVAAGVLDEEETRLGVDGRLLPLRYAYTRDDFIRALASFAASEGPPLRQARYTRWRETVHREARARGELVALPAADTIRAFFGSRNAALEAAGLPPVEARQPSFTGKKRPSYAREEKIDWLQQAWAEIGEPFTSVAYENRRRARTDAGLEPGPSLTSLAGTFGTWGEAARHARPASDPETSRKRIDE